MRAFRFGLAVAGMAALGGCSAAQMSSFSGRVAAIEPGLATACRDAEVAANLAGLVPGVGAIVPYITAGCATAEGLAKLAADPSSTEWVGTLTGQVKALAGAVGLKL